MAATRAPRATAPPRRRRAKQPAQPTGPVTVESGVTVEDLSGALGVPMSQIIKILMGLGQMRTATQSLSDEEVELIATEVEREVTIKHAADDDEPEIVEDAEADLTAAPTGRDDHGSRRPRQDDAARRDPLDRGRRDRGRRHHAAHRRVPGRHRRRKIDVPRYPGSRGVHRHARPRRQGDGHRRPRRRGGRRRDAANQRGDQPREGRRCADRRGDQQDRHARREPRPRARASLPPRACSPRTGAATQFAEVRRSSRRTSTSCSRRFSSSRTPSSTCARTRRPTPPGRSSSRGSTWAAARSRPCSSSEGTLRVVTRSCGGRRGQGARALDYRGEKLKEPGPGDAGRDPRLRPAAARG